MVEYSVAPYNPISYMGGTKLELEVFTARLRDSKWQKVRLQHIHDNPVCAVCGTNKELEVHHIRPFEYWPELELVKENFVTLCMTENHNCHINWGHLFNWHLYNPKIIEMVKLLKMREQFNVRDDQMFLTNLLG